MSCIIIGVHISALRFLCSISYKLETKSNVMIIMLINTLGMRVLDI